MTGLAMNNTVLIPQCDIRCIWDGGATLGEGPFWSSEEGRLYFVDIREKRLYRLDPESGVAAKWQFDEEISCVAPGPVRGTLLAAFRSGIGLIDLVNGRRHMLFTPTPVVPTQRFNDGKLDLTGALWVGTMDDTEHQDIGIFYRYSLNGAVQIIDEGFGITKGPAFAPDEGTVYIADSKIRTIYRLIFDYMEGRVLKKVVFATFSGSEGYPDGMTCDQAGNLWVSCWDGWSIRIFSPTGDCLGKICLPVQRPTSVTFTPNFKHLFVTSASVGLATREMDMPSLAGNVFEIGCDAILRM
jgi:sugar lactone lactonase YvrE